MSYRVDLAAARFRMCYSAEFRESDHPRDDDGKFKTYYRIQPKGLGIDHQSSTSNGIAKGLHVFENPAQLFGAEGNPRDYGDEVVEIHSPKHRDNGDVEGVEIDPRQSKIGRRWSLQEFPKAVAPWIDEFGPDDIEHTKAYEGLHHWYGLQNRHREFDMTPEDEETFHKAVP